MCQALNQNPSIKQRSPEPQSCSPGGFPRAMGLNWVFFCPLGGIWQRLETFPVVMTGGKGVLLASSG